MEQPSALPWYGFWQLVTDEPEEVIPHNRTTIAHRPHIGFSVYTERHFIEVRSLGLRPLPQSSDPTAAEAVALFDLLHVCAGHCTWTQSGAEWHADHHLTDALDPRSEGTVLRHRLTFAGDTCTGVREAPDRGEITETWYRLSGKGAPRLAGAWQSDDPEHGRWMYLVTGGHYGVIRNGPHRLKKAPDEPYSPAEIQTIFEAFGFNVGARLETAHTFDHWPFMAQTPGYETHKHQTFQIVRVAEAAFAATIPPYLPAQDWQRLGG